MKRYSRHNLKATWIALLAAATAGCHSTKNAAPVILATASPSPMATATPLPSIKPIPTAKFDVVENANDYIKKNIGDKSISADKRGVSTDYFLQNVSDETLGLLDQSTIADLYEGLTDCQKILNRTNCIITDPKSGEPTLKKEKIKLIAKAYNGRFIRNFIKLSKTAALYDAELQWRVDQTLRTSFTPKTDLRNNYTGFENVSIELLRNPTLWQSTETQSKFCTAVANLGNGFADNITGKPHKLKARFAHFDPNSGLEIFYRSDKSIFDLSKEKIASNFSSVNDKRTANAVVLGEEALTFHESIHAAISDEIGKNNQSSFVRIIRVSRNYTHLPEAAYSIYPNTTMSYQTYLSLPEERFAYFEQGRWFDFLNKFIPGLVLPDAGKKVFGPQMGKLSSAALQPIP